LGASLRYRPGAVSFPQILGDGGELFEGGSQVNLGFLGVGRFCAGSDCLVASSRRFRGIGEKQRLIVRDGFKATRNAPITNSQASRRSF
jgi:hypothetical protein